MGTMNIKEKMFEASVKFGIPRLLNNVIKTDVDLFTNIDSATELSIIEKCTRRMMPDDVYHRTQYPHDYDAQHGDCLELVLKQFEKKKSLSEWEFIPKTSGLQKSVEENFEAKNIKI